MKVLLIAPASGGWHGVGRSPLFGGRVFRFSLLSLLAVAAETPAGVEVRIVDEQVQEVPLDGAFDLVGITCMTAAAPRAYALADAFRARGIPVVLGGMHPTLVPDEALAHADAVCAGDAEGAWARIVEDARARRLSGIYRSARGDLASLAPPPRHLLDPRRYGTVQAVQATRGCPHRCTFCSVAAFHGGSVRRRPVAEVAAEVAALPRRFLVFVDDNLVADRAYALDLFEALRPLRKLWVTQASLDLAGDPELVARAAEAGCIGVFVGMETFSERNLAAVDKEFNRVALYRERVRTLHAHGIGVEAGIVLGFDGDRPGTFRRTLRMLEELGIDMVQVSILTPLPGTPLHRDLASRILDRDWSRYDFHHVVFRPVGMSAAQLQAGHDWLTREFYRPWRIVRRLGRMLRSPRLWRALPFAVAINLAYYGRTWRWAIRGWDPARSGQGQAGGLATSLPSPQLPPPPQPASSPRTR